MADQNLAKRLQARIVGFSALGILAVGTIIALAGILPLAQQLREAQIKSLQFDLRKRTERVEEFVARARQASQSRAVRGQLRDSLEEYAQRRITSDEVKAQTAEWLGTTITLSTNAVGVCVLDAGGEMLGQAGVLIPRQLWRIPDDSARESLLHGPVRVGREAYMISSAPILSSRSDRIGTDIVLYKLTTLERVVRDYSSLRPSGETLVGDLNNKEFPLFFEYRRSAEGSDSRKSASVRKALKLAQSGASGVLMGNDLPDPSLVIAYEPVPSLQWGVLVKINRAELLAPVNRRLAITGAVIVALILFGTLGMVVLVRPFTGRLILHTDELESQIYEKTAALNTELAERKRAEQMARDSEALYQSLVDTLPVSILRKDLQGRVTYGNRGYCEKMGKPLSALVGKTDFDLFPRNLAEKYSKDDDKVITTGQIFEDIEENRAGDGQRIYVHVLKAPVRDAKAAVVGTQVIFWDVTARKLAEEALEKAAAELARSNKELEQFAYVASHDLQEPLRMVTSYTQLVGKRYADKLDDNAREFMQFAVDGAMRMQRLIQDLLLYSRVGTRGKPFEPTSCDQVLDAALANLRLAVEESCAAITRDALPTILADPVQLTQLFQNLIGNALKFRGEEPPRIHVTALRRPRTESVHGGAKEEWVVSARDNGIGIEPRYFERIFIIFQRLHTHDQFPGTGIGLAICKKIVERHGGCIWVESTPGQGATFHFTFPVID